MRKNIIFLAFKTNQFVKFPFPNAKLISWFSKDYRPKENSGLKKEYPAAKEQQSSKGLKIAYFSAFLKEDLFTKEILPASESLESFLRLLGEINKEYESNRGLYEEKFEQACFKKYSYLISVFLEKNKAGLKEAPCALQYQALEDFSKLQKAIGGVKSSKTVELEKKLLNGIFSNPEKLSEINLVSLLEVLVRLDFRGKSSLKLLFTSIRSEFSKYSEGEPGVSNCLKILKYMVQLDFKEEVIALFICEILNKNLKALSIQDLSLSLFNFVRLRIKLNKYFLLQVCSQVLHKKHTIKFSHAQILLSSFAESEKITSKNGPYIEELDEMYKELIAVIKNSLAKYSYADLAIISNSLQKISYYDEELLEKITDLFVKGLNQNTNKLSGTALAENKAMADLEALDPSSPEYREALADVKRKKLAELKRRSETKNEITCEILCKVLHCLAVFSKGNSEFLKLFYDFLEKSAATGQNVANPLFLCLAIWSVCGLDPSLPPSALKTINVLVRMLSESSFERKYEINDYEVSILNLSIKFLKNSTEEAKQEAQKISNLFGSILTIEQSEEKRNVNKVSMLCLDVCKYLEALRIPIEVEKNIADNIFADIFVPEKVLGKGLVIEIHGYQHFMRNVERLKGGSVLKKHLVEKMGYIYEFIPAYEWQLLEDSQKPQYIERFLTLILNKKIIPQKV